MGGTGSKQEDQIITVALEKQVAPKKFVYVPYQGGGAGRDAARWRPRELDRQQSDRSRNALEVGRPSSSCVFDNERMPFSDKVTADQSWADIPTCQESGVDVDYQMLRGIFMGPAMRSLTRSRSIRTFAKVAATEDWQKFMKDGAFSAKTMKGDEFVAWLTEAEASTRL